MKGNDEDIETRTERELDNRRQLNVYITTAKGQRNMESGRRKYKVGVLIAGVGTHCTAYSKIFELQLKLLRTDQREVFQSTLKHLQIQAVAIQIL